MKTNRHKLLSGTVGGFQVSGPKGPFCISGHTKMMEERLTIQISRSDAKYMMKYFAYFWPKEAIEAAKKSPKEIK